MASDETTPRVIASELLQATESRAVLSLDIITGRVVERPALFPDLLDTIEPLLHDMPTPKNLFNPDKLQTFGACFINLSESFRMARKLILGNRRNKKSLIDFWSISRKWMEDFQAFVFTEDMNKLEGNVTPSGIHDVWDLAGWVSLVLYEFALIPELIGPMRRPQFQAAQIRLWVRVRVCTRPRILLEDRIGDVLDLILDHEPGKYPDRHNRIFAETLEEFSDDFILECYHRVIGRVRDRNFALKGHDTWTSCFRFVQIVYMHSEPLWLQFLANGCLYFQLHAFRRHMSPHSAINGRDAYIKFFSGVLHSTVPAIADSPVWVPQAIDSHLIPIIVGSSIFYQDLKRADGTIVEDLISLFTYLRANLIHRSVLKLFSAHCTIFERNTVNARTCLKDRCGKHGEHSCVMLNR